MGDSARDEDVRDLVIHAPTVELQNAEFATDTQALRAATMGKATGAERLGTGRERIRVLDHQVEQWTAAHAKLNRLRRTIKGRRRAPDEHARARVGYSQRRACGLVGLKPKTYRHARKRPDDGEVRGRLRALEAVMD